MQVVVLCVLLGSEINLKDEAIHRVPYMFGALH